MQPFASVLQLLEGLHDRLRHPLVRFLRPADEGKLFRDGDPFVAIGIVQAQPEQVGALFPFLRHST